MVDEGKKWRCKYTKDGIKKKVITKCKWIKNGIRKKGIKRKTTVRKDNDEKLKWAAKEMQKEDKGREKSRID